MKRKTVITLVWLFSLLAIVPALAAIVGSLPYTLTNGTTADATQVMANYQAIINDVNANGAHNGVNADITALTALSTPLTKAQGGATTYIGGTSTGTANAQVVASPVPTGMALAAGQQICFTPGATNTAALTLNANSLGVKNVFRQSPSGVEALTGGEVVSGGWSCATYNGTQFVLNTSGYQRPGVGPTTVIATGTTTDIGTIPSHNVYLFGTSTITSLGSSASLTYPEYQLTFGGGATLTHGASMVLPGAANILVDANDSATAVYQGAGVWILKNYMHIGTPPTGQFQGVQYFTASGTWTRPAGVRSAIFICAGGGAAGGGANDTGGGQGSAGSGGGAGGWAQLRSTAPASSYTITIGAGGVGASATTGGNGGNTTVGAILTCNGGTGGGAQTATANALPIVGGTGGTATSGDLNISGANGGMGVTGTSGLVVVGGVGGSNPLGHGGAGASALASSADGGAATQCGGAGGGAAAAVAAGTAQTGGAGAAGCVIAYSYY